MVYHNWVQKSLLFTNDLALAIFFELINCSMLIAFLTSLRSHKIQATRVSFFDNNGAFFVCLGNGANTTPIDFIQ